MTWYSYRYADDEKPSDFAADPFFREPYTSSYVPTCNPILHDDGLLYYGMYLSTADTGYLLVSRPPAMAAVADGILAPTSLLSWNRWIFLLTYGASGDSYYQWYYPPGTHPTAKLSTAATTGVAAPGQMIQTRDRVIVAFTGTNNVIKRLAIDQAAPGTSLTMPGADFGISTKMSYRVMAEYKGKVYILGTDDTGATIYSADGDTVAIARTGLTGAAYTLAVFNDYLYYLTGVNLGRFDGSTWTDAHDDITALSGEMLLVYKGNLLIFNGVQCHKSDGTDTTTWTATASTTVSDAHPGQGAGEIFHVVY
jgi:hypothetical protein